MRDITNEILELIRRTSSSLPKDVEDRLRASIEKEEPGSAPRRLPEAMWVIEVKSFPVVVTMDAHGQSKDSLLDESSPKVLDDLLARPY